MFSEWWCATLQLTRKVWIDKGFSSTTDGEEVARCGTGVAQHIGNVNIPGLVHVLAQATVGNQECLVVGNNVSMHVWHKGFW